VAGRRINSAASDPVSEHARQPRPGTAFGAEELSVSSPAVREGAKTTSVTLPRQPAIVPAARRLIRALLAGTPRAQDMELIACEIIGSFIPRTPVTDDATGLTFTLHTAPGWARVEVTHTSNGDCLAQGQHDYPGEDYLHSSRIIDGFSDKWALDCIAEGIIVNGCTAWIVIRQTVWAEAGWAQ
jgi:hypothetical protein